MFTYTLYTDANKIVYAYRYPIVVFKPDIDNIK